MNMLFGWVMHVKPGPQNVALGHADVTWEIYETQPEGVESVESQLFPDWHWTRHLFGFADDMKDYAGLDGVCAFRQFNGPEIVQCAPLYLGKHNMAAEFVLCGYIEGQAVPFHTEEQAHEVIAWFITKQAQWHDRYSPEPDGATSEESATPEADRNAGPAQRSERKTVH